MKCIILPKAQEDFVEMLSSPQYPTTFQKIIVRNMPYCDEFIIIANESYRLIIEKQLSFFQGLTYTYIYAEVEKRTTIAITLACMQLSLSDTVLVVSNNLLVENRKYQSALMKAKQLSIAGKMVTLNAANELQNNIVFIFCVKNFLQELQLYAKNLYLACKKTYERRISNQTNSIYEMNMTKKFPAEFFEYTIFDEIIKLNLIEFFFEENDTKKIEKLQDVSTNTLQKSFEPIIKLNPAFKDFLWGGTKLKELYQKESNYSIIAESWELSAHISGQSVVASGEHVGMPLAKYLELIGKEAWGWKCNPYDNFPILIKFIDARQSLSIQVHPNDEYALKKENQSGKNELWYILDCESDAYIYCGFKRKVTRDEVGNAIQNNTILDLLNKIFVKKGDTYFIPAGTIHAIGKGILICEIQQNSNCTYRLYDYNRKDKFGSFRELHIKQGLDVLHYDKYEFQDYSSNIEYHQTYTKCIIGSCKYFKCILYDLKGENQISLGEESFTSFICIEGCGTLQLENQILTFMAGESIFMKKSATNCQIVGICKFVMTQV